MTLATTPADHERERVAALREYDVLDHPLEDGLLGFAELAAKLCRTACGVLNLIDDRFQYQVATYGTEPSVSDRYTSICALTLSEQRQFAVRDARTDPRLRDNPWVSGELGTIRCYASSPLRTPAGLVIGTICVYDDEPKDLDPDQLTALDALSRGVMGVLELRRRSMLLRETVAELSRSHSQLAEFASQISHDLKTPLTASLGYGELLQDHPSVRADPTVRSFVDKSVSANRRMMSAIDNLLDYATVGGTLYLEPVWMPDLVAEVREDLGAAAEDAQIRCDEAVVVADRVQLGRLLQNLIGNSLRFRRPGVRCEVAVAVSPAGGGSELRVVDNGLGIPPEKRLEVLSPLVRLHPKLPGTGLGLATCLRIAAAHGGTLAITDAAGGGTTVRVALPSWAQSASD